MLTIHFGQAGWHEHFDEGFSVASVARLANSLALIWADAADGATVYVAYDSRKQSLEAALAAASALDALGLAPRVSADMVPPAALALAVGKDTQAIGGLYVGAADFPLSYNGLIAFGADGGPLSAELCAEVDQLLGSDSFSPDYKAAYCDMKKPYLEALAAKLDAAAFANASLKLVVDSQAGAATGYARDLLAPFGVDCAELRKRPAEDFCGEQPLAVERRTRELTQAVLESQADLGILFDGDGCRLLVVDELGHAHYANDFMPLLLTYLKAEHGLSAGLAMTQTCSARLELAAAALDLDCITTPVGFVRLYSELQEADVALACEEYGGVAFADHVMQRDGILCAAYLAELVAQADKPLSQLLADLEADIPHMYYERKDLSLDAAVVQRFRNILPGLNPGEIAGETPARVSHADGLKLTFEDGSWLSLRPSRSRAIVRAYAEAYSQERRDLLLSAAVELTTSKLQ